MIAVANDNIQKYSDCEHAISFKNKTFNHLLNRFIQSAVVRMSHESFAHLI